MSDKIIYGTIASVLGGFILYFFLKKDKKLEKTVETDPKVEIERLDSDQQKSIVDQ